MTSSSETARQAVHMAVGLAALSLRWLTWQQAAICATLAIAFNALVLPRSAGRAIFRENESGRTHASGIVLYPVAVLVLILAFRERLDLAAAAWGILAFGDGAATIAGRACAARSGRWPWNRDKSYAGSLAFVAAGAFAGVAFAWWTSASLPTPRPLSFVVFAPVIAAIVAMFAETLPVRLDDNITVALSAGATLAALSIVDLAVLREQATTLASRAPFALLVNAAVAFASWRLRTVSISGVLAGLAVGIVIWLSGGASAWTLLFVAFAVAAITSRIGLARKRLLGIDEARGGRRGAGNVLANCGLASVAAFLSMASPHANDALLVMTAALVAGSSDTAASEVGKAFGRRTWSVTTLREVAPGTIGAMSLPGTLAGLGVAAALAALAAAVGLVPATAVWMLASGALAAMLVESVLGARYETRGFLNNDLLNFINTAVAAATTLLLWRAFA